MFALRMGGLFRGVNEGALFADCLQSSPQIASKVHAATGQLRHSRQRLQVPSPQRHAALDGEEQTTVELPFVSNATLYSFYTKVTTRRSRPPTIDRWKL